MKLHRSVVAVCAATALTLSMPAAAHAGGKTKSPAKGKAPATQQAAKAKAKAKAEAARKKAEAARRKAADARWHGAFPGTVTAVGAGTVTVSRKVRSVSENRQLVLAPNAVVVRDGVRITLAEVAVGDKVVAHLRKVDGAVRVVKLNVAPAATPAPAPAPVVSDSGTATILI